MRECDLAAEFESYIRKHGATKTSFDSIVAAGENAAYPHYITGNRILRKNDIVLCDIGALVDGYCSDLTRTFFLGKISPLGRTVYDTVARAQQLAIEAVKPGVKTAQIDRIARDEIERAGYGRRFIHSTGHGVGVEIHEAPWVGPASTETLEPGMIITVEPGIYLQGWGGVRIEDTLLVTEDRLRNFNEIENLHDRTVDFRNGLIFEYEGSPYQILWFQNHKTAMSHAIMRVKMKNLLIRPGPRCWWNAYGQRICRW